MQPHNINDGKLVKKLRQENLLLKAKLNENIMFQEGKRIGQWTLDKGYASFWSKWHYVPTSSNRYTKHGWLSNDTESIREQFKLPYYFIPTKSKILSKKRDETDTNWVISWRRTNKKGDVIDRETQKLTIDKELWNIINLIDTEIWIKCFINEEYESEEDIKIIIDKDYRKDYDIISKSEIIQLMGEPVENELPEVNPEDKDIVSILEKLGTTIPSGDKLVWNDFWQLILLPTRHDKIGKKQTEMREKCKNEGIPWKDEPIRIAVKLLFENNLLKKEGARYSVNYNYVISICK